MNGDLVEQKLHFNTEHELLSNSMATNVFGGETEFFECKNGDREEEIKKISLKFCE